MGMEPTCSQDLENGSDLNLSSAEGIKIAEANGMIASFPLPHQLFLDIDDEAGYKMFLSHKTYLLEHFGMKNFHVRPSKSGLPKRHIIVNLNRDLTPTERIALQACLGSDRKREILSLVRVGRNDPHATLFFDRDPDFMKSLETLDQCIAEMG
jgi:hypothetical protein